MADLPIIFSAPMIKALLDGRKTQTRRVIKSAPANATSAGTTYSSLTGHSNVWTWLSGDPRDCETWQALDDFRLPHAVGDRLWVKEDFCFDAQMDGLKPSQVSKYEPRGYPANNWIIEPACMMVRAGRLRSARFMPRWASRLTLTVTDVRVQRLQEISEADAIAEGVTRCAWAEDVAGDGRHQWYVPAESPGKYLGLTGIWYSPLAPFRELWEEIHGPDALSENPWVAAYTFTVQRGNIDKLGEQAILRAEEAGE